MKSKAPLPLMEQLIMILVFALTAALCLQGFSLSSRISHRQENRDRAISIAQNAAEMLKSVSGDFAQSAGQMDGTWDGSAWIISYDEAWQPLADSGKEEFQMRAVSLEDHDPYLGTAKISVLQGKDLLFEITVGWQEVE